ncbi:hypothetical protein CRG98_044035 [Punica granatum]|uniref:Secreted protein n=1 Tax=Punica granatum TaxID=22663 RepID=A0A2I0HV56_PUNGR|nr:hypothetical protein CRG98_044035 [Punica granatum]
MGWESFGFLATWWWLLWSWAEPPFRGSSPAMAEASTQRVRERWEGEFRVRGWAKKASLAALVTITVRARQRERERGVTEGVKIHAVAISFDL